MAQTPTEQFIPCELIETEDHSTQMRAQISPACVRQYADIWENAVEAGEVYGFPPVDLYCDGATYWIGDGWHRVLAAKSIDMSGVPAKVYTGNKDDAMLHAAKSNGQHGLALTKADRLKCATVLLRRRHEQPEDDRQTFVEIAHLVGFNRQTVSALYSRLFPEVTEVAPPEGDSDGSPDTDTQEDRPQKRKAAGSTAAKGKLKTSGSEDPVVRDAKLDERARIDDEVKSLFARLGRCMDTRLRLCPATDEHRGCHRLVMDGIRDTYTEWERWVRE